MLLFVILLQIIIYLFCILAKSSSFILTGCSPIILTIFYCFYKSIQIGEIIVKEIKSKRKFKKMFSSLKEI